jgi:hypothetical protein
MSHEAVRIQQLEEQVRDLRLELSNFKDTHNYNVSRYTWIEAKVEKFEQHLNDQELPPPQETDDPPLQQCSL